MRYFDGMISVELKYDLNETKKVLEQLPTFHLSGKPRRYRNLHQTPCHNDSTPPLHKKNAKNWAITDGFIHLSVGIESITDLRPI